MPQRLLFLLGGSGALEAAAEEFVPAAGGRDAVIALLMQGGEKFKKYIADYSKPWVARGVNRYHAILPGDSGTLDQGEALARLRDATGIFIGGGATLVYHRLYATGPMSSILREKYEKGVPIAGCSAGALIAPEICSLSSEEVSSLPGRTLPGLGLIRNIVVGVHFTERNALPGMLEAMARTKTKTGWGVDEAACAVFENEQFKKALGTVYEVVMTNFEAKTHKIKKHKAQ